MKKHLSHAVRIALAATLSAGLLLTGLAGCGQKISNENTPLVLASQELDGVFNPFFATSGYDTEAIGPTQLGMLTTGKNGELLYGDNEACVVKDYKVVTTGSQDDQTTDDDYDNWYTTYEFVIKNGLKFSDGSPLTIKDVLFTLYLYLDPVYTGSTTIYSTNIKGLKAYRTQTENASEQGSFEVKFDLEAKARIAQIENWCDSEESEAQASEQVRKDLATMRKLFREELESDWSNAAAGVQSYQEDGYSEIKETWQAFFVQEGFITLDEDKKTVKNWGGTDTYVAGLKDKDEASLKKACVDYVYNDKVENAVLSALKDNVYEIVKYWKTAATLREALSAEAKTEYFAEMKEKGELPVPAVSGITTEKATSFNGKDLGGEHSVLRIVVNGVDPKAIYNFSFSVAPMSYYSTAALAQAADPAKNKFGVSFGDTEFMNSVKLKDVPMGAGPYKAVSYDRSEYFKDNIVRYERNEHFLLGPAKIRLLQYKVVNAYRRYDAVANGEVHYADPDAKIETLEQVKGNGGLGYTLLENLGYGYIGINAKYVPDIEVRQAIMTTLDPQLCLSYYPANLASVIDRPMSKVSWAYPHPNGYEPYYTYDKSGAKARELIEACGWQKNARGVYAKRNAKGQTEELKLTFTIAGESESHPAAATLKNSMEILNKIGCKVTVVNDPNALSKLSSGGLAVWAAAWSSTIDPDMYQVYHKDSTATSVLNWGYPSIMADEETYADEIALVETLSEKIDDARKTNNRDARKAIYAEALDIVMEMAVEFPMYQRKNLYVWNKNVIDESTLTPDADRDAYNGPLAHIWEVGFKEG